MSVECSECERDARAGHAPGCSRALSLVERLRDYDSCHDGDVDEAADMLEFLLNQFQMHSPDMGGQHSYRFRDGSWPMTHAKGPTVEAAIRNAMAEVKRHK